MIDPVTNKETVLGRLDSFVKFFSKSDWMTNETFELVLKVLSISYKS